METQGFVKIQIENSTDRKEMASILCNNGYVVFIEEKEQDIPTISSSDYFICFKEKE